MKGWLTRLLRLVKLSETGCSGGAALSVSERAVVTWLQIPTSDKRVLKRQEAEMVTTKTEKMSANATLASHSLTSASRNSDLHRESLLHSVTHLSSKEAHLHRKNDGSSQIIRRCSLQAISAASGGRNLKYLFLEHITKIFLICQELWYWD